MPAVTTRLEPATCDEIDLGASGSVAHVVVPAVGRDLWRGGELRLAFLTDGGRHGAGGRRGVGDRRAVGVHVRRRSPAMLEFRVGAAPRRAGADLGPRARDAPPQAAAEVPQPEAEPAVAQTRRVLSLDWDGASFSATAGRDPVLDGLRRANPGIRPILFGSPYEAACWAVVCQGLRTEQAVALYSRLVTRYGRVVPVGGSSRVVLAPPAELRAVSPTTRLSARKRERLAVVAEAAEAGLLDAAALRSMEPGEAVDLVDQLPGIGPLSAELVVARGAGHPDVFPAHDRVLVAAMRELYDGRFVDVAERWRPYRSWASFVIRSAAVLHGVRPGVSR